MFVANSSAALYQRAIPENSGFEMAVLNTNFSGTNAVSSWEDLSAYNKLNPKIFHEVQLYLLWFIWEHVSISL